MDIAVFSDIHGNYVAFQKCVEYALERRIVTFIFLGDYLGEFPYPQKTMEMLYSLKEKYKCFFVKGNKEDYWLNRRKDNNCEWKDGNSTTGALQYCYSNLTDRDIDFFGNLSICQEVKFEGAETLLACHGSPNSNNEKMLPDNDKTKSTIEQCKQKYILCGHTHFRRIIEHDGKVILNPGSIGASLHSGGKAQFMILHKDIHEWKYQFIDLDYDKEKVIKEIQESGLSKSAPYWSKMTKHLIITGEVSHGEVLARAMKLCEEDLGKGIWSDIPEKYWKMAVEEMLGDN